MQSERIVILGAGAVGCYFGGMLARAGVPVTLVGRPAHIEAIQRHGLFLERDDFQEFIHIDAHPTPDAVQRGTMVLLCVKTVDTETAARALAPYLGKDAILASFQNGVDNVDRIYRATRIRAVPAVVYVAVTMTGPGRVKHGGRGDLVIGEPEIGLERPEYLQRIASLFESAQIPCRISTNIAAELWTKLVMNCAYNAISAVTQSRYLPIRENPLTQDVIAQLVGEVVAVGRAAGVSMPDAGDLTTAAFKLGEGMAQATSSTAQDLARGRPTEIDSLNGYVAGRGRELGVPTPVNSTLHALVNLLETQTVVKRTFTGGNP